VVVHAKIPALEMEEDGDFEASLGCFKEISKHLNLI
jgi:hypothetical protein